MGSGSSKDDASAAVHASSSSHNPSSSSSCSSGRSPKARLVRVFHSSPCFGRSLRRPAKVEEEGERSKDGATCVSRIVSNSVGEYPECAVITACAHHDKEPSLPSSDDNQIGEEHDDTLPRDLGGSSSASSSSIVGPLSSSGRFRSRFSFIPDGISFRLSRTISLGSSHTHPLFPATSSVSNNENESGPILNRNCSSNNPIGVIYSANGETSSSQDFTVCAGSGGTLEQCPISNHLESHATAVRPSYRSNGGQESLERSVRFSRTLSVGRLRDRVLRRTALSEGLFSPSFLENGSLRHYRQDSGRRLLSVRRTSSARNNEVVPNSSAISSRTFSSSDINENLSSDINHNREHDLLEHRSAFLERRRRIRSQVRALQRLGNRFESLSGHDRSCILSGRHRTGRCSCRTNNRASNPDDDNGTRASISRIVMLAEALFEVLDEIHQQSVVLSSRPSFSSIGSVPAPKEVVERIPVKLYSKPLKLENEEDAQCYICLVEYEEGDCMRVLPCKHEFHQSCVDKWLKEIHRVCPLCRGDVCSLDSAGR